MTNPSDSKFTKSETCEVSSTAQEAVAGGVPLWKDWLNMFTEVFQYHELLWQMLLRDIRVRYKQAVMGFFWAVFSPLMVVMSGFVLKYVMSVIAGSTIDAESFSNMAVKAVGWSLFIGIVGGTAQALVNNIGLITKIYFPREVLPLAVVCTQLFDSAIGAGVLLVMLACIGGITWSVNLLWVPVFIVLILMQALAIGMFVSSAMVFYRDVKYLLSVFTSFGIFYTPIFYESYQLGNPFAWIIYLNPIAPLLEGLRLAFVQGHNLFVPLYMEQGVAGQGVAEQVLVWHPGFFIYSAVFSVLGLALSWRHFHKMEKKYAEFI